LAPGDPAGGASAQFARRVVDAAAVVVRAGALGALGRVAVRAAGAVPRLLSPCSIRLVPGRVAAADRVAPVGRAG
jgi:hypothetical protein